MDFSLSKATTIMDYITMAFKLLKSVNATVAVLQDTLDSKILQNISYMPEELFTSLTTRQLKLVED